MKKTYAILIMAAFVFMVASMTSAQEAQMYQVRVESPATHNAEDVWIGEACSIYCSISATSITGANFATGLCDYVGGGWVGRITVDNTLNPLENGIYVETLTDDIDQIEISCGHYSLGTVTNAVYKVIYLLPSGS